MSDLYDLAKPVRDAVCREMDRIAPDAMGQAERDAMALGVHFVALLAAWGSQRHGIMHGVIRDAHLQDVVSSAIGQLLANSATTFRPTVDGKPITPSANVNLMAGKILHEAYRMAASFELGLTDFLVPIGRRADGSLHVVEPDVMAMLGGDK